MTPNTRLHAPHRTSHPRPPPPRPPPRLGGKEMRRWDSPKEEAQARMGGFNDAPRCPASLTFRDSPALLRQESDGYPVRPAACYPFADRPSPLPFPDPDEPMTVASALRPRALPPPEPPPPPPPPHTHTHTHTHTRRRASAARRHTQLKRKRKKGMRRPARETPRLCKPQRGAAIAEAVPKHNSKTRSGPGGLGGSLPDRRCTGLGTRR